MKIEKDTVVTVHYVLTNKAGEVVDSSREHNEPLEYLHGHQMMIPGFEKNLTQRTAGESISFDVTWEEGYGPKDQNAIFEVPKSEFPPEEKIEVGMRVYGTSEAGQERTFAVIGVNDEVYILDGNHPLAGEDIHFEVEILNVRAATPQEVEHRHTHPGGHDH